MVGRADADKGKKRKPVSLLNVAWQTVAKGLKYKGRMKGNNEGKERGNGERAAKTH